MNVGTQCVLLVAMLLAMGSAPKAPAEEKADGSNLLKVGDQAPGFEIEVLGGKTFKLADHVGKQEATVLIFDRAHW